MIDVPWTDVEMFEECECFDVECEQCGPADLAEAVEQIKEFETAQNMAKSLLDSSIRMALAGKIGEALTIMQRARQALA